MKFEGEGEKEKGFIESIEGEFVKNIKVGQCVVEVDSRYFRPTEVELLIGDATKAKEKLGWIPEFSLNDLIKDMIESDLKLMRKEKFLKDEGYNTLNYFE